MTNRPLSGIRVIEMAGIGPAPFCAMMLADMGAEIIRIDRHSDTFLGGGGTAIERGRRNLILDLKQEEAKDIVKKLVATADILIEGFRPGVMERLGLGPDDCFAINPALIYGRMTGWGQEGPLSKRPVMILTTLQSPVLYTPWVMPPPLPIHHYT